MADEKKPKKSKKKEKVEEAAEPAAAAEGIPEEAPPPAAAEEAAAPPPATEAPPPAEPEPAPAPQADAASAKSSAKRKSGRDSKKAVKNSSNIFDNFTNDEVDQFKAGFQFMDMDKDGIISKDDLRACMDYMGRVSNEKELDAMVAEATGPINFTQLLTLFFNRMSAAGDGDHPDTIFNAFSCYMDKDGCYDALKFRDILMSGENKFSDQEADTALGEMDIENGRIDMNMLISRLSGTVEEGEA